MTVVLQGPFLTRSEAARRAGIDVDHLVNRPDLLRITGPWTQETYYAFQFDGGGLRRDVAEVVVSLRSQSDDNAIADWLVRPHEDLAGLTPLARLNTGGSAEQVLAAAAHCGPASRVKVTAPPLDSTVDRAPTRRKEPSGFLRHHRRVVHGL